MAPKSIKCKTLFFFIFSWTLLHIFIFQMVCTLNNNGANNIWEHALLENGGKLLKKKPSAKDPIR